MMQKEHIKQELENFGLNVGTANGKFTPAKEKPLSKHVHVEPACGNFNYSNMVGMLLYLAGHSCTDITCAVNCAERYIFCKKLVHQHALKRIGRYQKATSDKGLIIKLSEKLSKIDSFPDAKFCWDSWA